MVAITIAILRCLAAFLAGVNQLPLPRFLVANAAGAVLGAIMLAIGANIAWLAWDALLIRRSVMPK